MNKFLLTAFLSSAAFFSSPAHADEFSEFVIDQESRVWAGKAFELRENPEDYHVVRGAEDPEREYATLLDALGFDDMDEELIETLEYAEEAYELTGKDYLYVRVLRAENPRMEFERIERQHWAAEAYQIKKSRSDYRYVATSISPERAYQEVLEKYLRRR